MSFELNRKLAAKRGPLPTSVNIEIGRAHV